MPLERRTRATLRAPSSTSSGWRCRLGADPVAGERPFGTGVAPFACFDLRPLRTSCCTVARVYLDIFRKWMNVGLGAESAHERLVAMHGPRPPAQQLAPALMAWAHPDQPDSAP